MIRPEWKMRNLARFLNGLHILLISSLAVNAALAWRVHKTSEYIRDLRAERLLKPGTQVSALRGADLGNKLVSVQGSGERSIILYVFTPECGWCKKNIANIKALAEQLPPSYGLIGVSLSSATLRDYIRANNLNMPIVTNVDSASLNEYRLGATPQTIVLSPQNRVIKVWTGAYMGPVKSDIESTLKVALPGIQPNTK